MLCSNVVKFVQQEIGEIVRYLPDQKNKISVASQTVATVRIAPKICQGQPPIMRLALQCSRFQPNRFTFGRVYSRTREHRYLPHRVFP